VAAGSVAGIVNPPTGEPALTTGPVQAHTRARPASGTSPAAGTWRVRKTPIRSLLGH
jgi:hypothetical protein